MKKFKLHHNDDLDGTTKGAWRAALLPSIYGTDGQPVAWKEIVVFTCPSCGCPQGVGGDDAQVVDGKTDREVKCHNCPWRDVLEFELHQDAKGRERFAKLKAQGEQGVKDARINHLHQKIREEMQADLNDRALDEAKKVMAAGGDPQELFRAAMAKKKLTS